MGIDIIDYYKCEISLRKLYNIFYLLPANSATMATLTGDKDMRRWDDLTYLIANCQDLLGLVWRANFQGKKKPPKFEPVKRPEFEEDKPTGVEAMDPRAIEYLNKYSSSNAGPQQVQLPAAPDETHEDWRKAK